MIFYQLKGSCDQKCPYRPPKTLTKTINWLFYTRLFIKAILMLPILMAIGAPFADAQNITLKANQTSLRSVMNKIEQQSGYDFWYNKGMINESEKINIDFKDQPLESVLKSLFAPRKLSFEMVDKTIFLKPLENKPKESQGISRFDIEGIVLDSEGKPIPGATLKIKSTNIVRVSNTLGRFNILNLTDDGILVVSSLGFAQTEAPFSGNRKSLEIVLQIGENKLEDVQIVSTGYQNLPKERATGSFTVIEKQQYNELVGSNVLSRLEYIANGVSVFRNNATRTTQLMVRGLSTINGPTSPLIIVDNFPYEGDINNLNPNDVESVTILKDAAAASIWGAKAGNGVIVITTKQGRNEQPLKIEVNSNLTLGDRPSLDYLTPMSSDDYIDFEKTLYSNGYFNSQISSLQYPVLSPVVNLLARVAKGNLTQIEADQQIDALRKSDIRNDYVKYIYKTPVNQQYYVNLAGGDKKIAYLFSTGYDKNKSELESRFRKLNLNSNINFQPLENLQLSAGLHFTNSNLESGKPGYGSANVIQPYQLLSDENGQAISAPQTYSQLFKDGLVSSKQFIDWNYYPLTDFQHSKTNTQITDVRGNFMAQYKMLKRLSLNLRYQFEKQQTTAKTLYDDQSYFSRNLVNSFTQVSGTTVNNVLPKGGIFDQQNGDLSSSNLRGQINFDQSWNLHKITILAGGEINALKNESNNFRTYGYNENVLTSAGVDYRTLYPNYVTKNTSRIPYINSFSRTLNRFVSVYANAAYSYSEKYIVSGSIRRDASNLFGVATNDKWTPLWSTGIGWLVSKEDFFNTQSIKLLKVRATYGFGGNVDPGRSALTTISYSSANSPYTNSPYSSVSNFSNPELRWEKTRTINIGIDFAGKENRISGSIDYYQKKSTDLYGTVPVDYTIGIGIATVTKNVAAMSGSGVDVAINTINLNGPVRWTSSLNANYYRDKVTTSYLSTTDGINYVNDNLTPVEGYPVWSVRSLRWAGLDHSGNPQGYISGVVSKDYSNLLGSGTSVDDLIYNGPRFPVFYGTLANSFSYKQLSLTVRLAYNFGNYFRRQSINYSSLATSGIGHSDYANRWLIPGDESRTNVPGFVYPLITSRDNFYSASEVLVEKADCIRLQNISINYSFLRSNAIWLPVREMQLYIVANNISIIWRANKLGIDPDYPSTNTLMPSPKTFSLGLKLTL